MWLLALCFPACLRLNQMVPPPSLDYDSYLSYQWTSLYLSRDILKKTGEIGKVTQLVSDKVISEFKTPFFNHWVTVSLDIDWEYQCLKNMSHISKICHIFVQDSMCFLITLTNFMLWTNRYSGLSRHVYFHISEK